MTFTGGVPAARGTGSMRGARRPGVGVYDAPPAESSRVQEPFVPTDGPSRDPRAALSAAIHGVAGAGDLQSAVDAVLSAAAAALDPAIGAILAPDPARPGLQAAASPVFDDTSTASVADGVTV